MEELEVAGSMPALRHAGAEVKHGQHVLAFAGEWGELTNGADAASLVLVAVAEVGAAYEYMSAALASRHACGHF